MQMRIQLCCGMVAAMVVKLIWCRYWFTCVVDATANRPLVVVVVQLTQHQQQEQQRCFRGNKFDAHTHALAAQEIDFSSNILR